MRGLAIVTAVLIQLCLCYGRPGASDGVGAFAYQDTTGNRYGGTYGLRDGQVVDVKGDYPPPAFAPHSFQDLDNFFPEYFRNFEFLIQDLRIRRSYGFVPRVRPFRRLSRFNSRAFGSDPRSTGLAVTAAHKAFDLASNQVGYMPNFDFRFPPFGGFPDFMRQGGPFPFDMSQNSAFAGAAAGPGYSHHVDMISPENPQSPNIDVTKTHTNPRNDGFYSVSSSSYASSSNVNGMTKNQRGSETKINNNGVVTHYKVQN